MSQNDYLFNNRYPEKGKSKVLIFSLSWPYMEYRSQQFGKSITLIGRRKIGRCGFRTEHTFLEKTSGIKSSTFALVTDAAQKEPEI